MSPRPPFGSLRAALRLALPLACVGLLSACASLMPQAGTALPDSPVPATWRSGPTAAQPDQATSLAAWWQRFDDPRLTDLVTRSLQANPSVRGAQAALRQARAQADVQQAGLGPRIDASASAQRSQSGTAAAGNLFQAGFDARWEPDLFGGNRRAVDASLADALASAATLADVQVSLSAETAIAYINLRGLQERLAIARSNLAPQLETLQLTRWRAQAGLVSSLDVEQAVAAAEQTRAQIPALQTSLVQSLNALAVLTGEAPGALDSALGDAAPIPSAPPDLALAFPADTLRQRPDVRAAEQRAVAALARVDVADAARHPSLQLSGSLGLSALTLGTLTSGSALLKSMLLGASAPLFDGGAGKAQVRAQQAALEQAQSAHRTVVLGALQEVEDALVALRGDQDRLARLQAAGSAAANAELLARHQYASGLIDFTTVLGTQRNLLSTQDAVASTQASLVADHVRLYKALGGGWRPATGSADPADPAAPQPAPR